MTTKPTHATKPSDRIHARDGGIGRSPTEEAIIEYLDEQAASANPAASPSGEVAAPSPVAPTCVRCDGPVEPKRWVYALPTCYACLPPPPPIQLLTDADFPKRAEQALRQHPDRCKCDGLYVGGVCTRCQLPWSPEQAPQAEATPPDEPDECDEDAAMCDCSWHENARRARESHRDPDPDVIRAAEGVTLEPGEYETVDARTGFEPLRFTVLDRSMAFMSDGKTFRFYIPERSYFASAVRRVPLTEPEPVPESGWDICASCGDTRLAHGQPRCEGECDLFMERELVTLCDEVDCPVHGANECEVATRCNKRLTKERDELRSRVSELEAARIRISSLQLENEALSASKQRLGRDMSTLTENWERQVADRAFDLTAGLRSTLTATEAKLAAATEKAQWVEGQPAWYEERCQALSDLQRAESVIDDRNAELARVRGELAAQRERLQREVLDLQRDNRVAQERLTRIRYHAGGAQPAETPAVAAPAVVQREIVVGSTWADTQGIYADGEVTSYNPQLPDTIRITGASSWSEPVFRCRWRHVSDPPTKESAGKRKS